MTLKRRDFIRTSLGALVVDSQYPDTAEACLRGLQERGGRSGRWLDALVNTHHHGDHVAGNGIFRPAARRLVALARAAELQREVAREEGTEEERTYPDTTFPDRWELQVGDETVRATHRGPAHTGDDAIFIFGHAQPGWDVTGSRQHVLAQRDCFAELLEAARRAVEAGVPRAEAVALDALPGFGDYAAPADFLSLEAALGAAYDELAGQR